jgi:D-alanine-D-alanine ligase
MVHRRRPPVAETLKNMQNTKPKVVILTGGPSAEASVSKQSAAQVRHGLENSGFSVQVIELDKNCAAELIKLEPDVVFPVLHGPPGEDGTAQGLLEILEIPYIGSDVRASAMAMDKAVAKDLFRRSGLPVTQDYLVQPNDNLEQAAKEITACLGKGVVIKPLNQGSALGVQLLPEGGDIERALSQCLDFGACLVEPFILGREITVGVLDTDDGSLVHPVIEICTAESEWYDFHNKYTPGQSTHEIPAKIDSQVSLQLQEAALLAHQALGLRDLSRSDFILTENDQIALLEINTLPGMTPLSLYPEGSAAIGYPFDKLVTHLVMRAFQRDLGTQ